MINVDNKVVVRFRDGRIVKGYTNDFFPNRAHFHVTEEKEDKNVIEVSISLLKAVFFVQNFGGKEMHSNHDDFTKESFAKIPGVKLKVTFFDGEVIYGSTTGYSPDRQGFFLLPANKESNNNRIFVIKESTTKVERWP